MSQNKNSLKKAKSKIKTINLSKPKGSIKTIEPNYQSYHAMTEIVNNNKMLTKNRLKTTDDTSKINLDVENVLHN